MGFLTRKISRAKWQDNGDLDDGEIQADAVTADLKTTGNTLSFWARETVEDADLQQAILAVATGLERIDRLDIAWVDSTAIMEAGLAVAETPGRTPVPGLVDSHRDIKRLDLVRLGRVSTLLHEAIGNDQHRRFSKKKVVGFITEAVKADLVSLDDLAEKVRAEVEKLLKT